MGDISAATFRLPTRAEKLRILLKQVLHGCGFMMLRGFTVDRYKQHQSSWFKQYYRSRI